MQFSALSAFILCNFHAYKWENAYIKDLYVLTILNGFFMYLFRWRKGGGGALMHVHVWEHIVSLSSRTASWIFMKLDRDEVLMVPYKCCCFSARSVKGRIQGGAKIGHWGSPSSTNFFFRPEGYSNKPNANQWSRSIWDEVLFFFGSIPKSNFWRVLWRLFGLTYFALFQCNFYRFLCCKVFNLHLFCIIFMFVSGRCLYKRFKCF